jgi:hypothetical protein
MIDHSKRRFVANESARETATKATIPPASQRPG